MASRIVVGTVEDSMSLVVEAITPFNLLSRDCKRDSIRFTVGAELDDFDLDNLEEDLASSPRAKLLVESFRDDQRVQWLEIFEDGLEVCLVDGLGPDELDAFIEHFKQSLTKLAEGSRLKSPVFQVQGAFFTTNRASRASSPS